MKSRIPARDPIGKAQRRSRAERRIGPGGKCACGETRPEALISDSSPMTCAECRRRQKGQSVMDRHHVAGQTNHDLTIPVPVNDHRSFLTEAMYDWPKQTRENPTGSPLLAAAACIRGFSDTVIYLIQELICWIADLLETLHEQLICEFGEEYWRILKDGFSARLR